MLTNRWKLSLLPASLTLTLLAFPARALAVYRGTDVWGNATAGGPGATSPHPVGAYGLDYHVDAGLTNLDQFPAQFAQTLAQFVWQITRTLVWLVVTVFGWAMNADFINGPHGLLVPVTRATQSLEANTFDESWLIAAITVAGIWATWKGLGQRRYPEALTGLAMSIVCVLIATTLIARSGDTIGWATTQVNQASNQVLGGGNQVTDRLFTTLIERPWALLEFGGLQHCVDWDHRDDGGFPRPVASGGTCRDVLHADGRGYGGYARHFLAYQVGSKERDQAYDAMRDGDLGDYASFGRTFPGWNIDKADAPAVDAMQAGGGWDRLALSLLFLLVALGAVLVLGTLALGMLAAQLAVLALLIAAPVLLIVGAIPNFGHRVFLGWSKKLGAAVVIKFVYAIALTCVVTVSSALNDTSSGLGGFWAFAATGAFYWLLFVYRRAIVSTLTSGHHDNALKGGAAAYGLTSSAMHHVTKRHPGRRHEHVPSDHNEYEHTPHTPTTKEETVRTPTVTETPVTHEHHRTGLSSFEDDLQKERNMTDKHPQRPASDWEKPTFEWLDDDGHPPVRTPNMPRIPPTPTFTFKRELEAARREAAAPRPATGEHVNGNLLETSDTRRETRDADGTGGSDRP